MKASLFLFLVFIVSNVFAETTFSSSYKKVSGSDWCSEQVSLKIDPNAQSIEFDQPFEPVGSGAFSSKEYCYVDTSGDQHKKYCRIAIFNGYKIQVKYTVVGLFLGLPISKSAYILDLAFNSNRQSFSAKFDSVSNGQVIGHENCVYETF